VGLRKQIVAMMTIVVIIGTTVGSSNNTKAAVTTMTIAVMVIGDALLTGVTLRPHLLFIIRGRLSLFKIRTTGIM